AAIGFRTGTRPRTGSPIGTCLAGPRPNRATRAASLRPGGTIMKRRRRSINKPRLTLATLLRPVVTSNEVAHSHWPPETTTRDVDRTGISKVLMAGLNDERVEAPRGNRAETQRMPLSGQ